MRYKLNVVRYLIAIMLVWGGMQISYGQDNTVSKDCPPASSSSKESRSSVQQQNMSEMEMSNDSLIQSKGNKEFIEIPAQGEFDYQYKGEKGKLDYKFEKEQGNDTSAKIELRDNQNQSNFSQEQRNMKLEQQNQSKGCPDTSGIGARSQIKGTTYVGNNYQTTVYAQPVEKKKHSAVGTILRAPVKFVANIPGAVASVVSETGQGVGHVVAAPFKGIARLFGRDESKDKYNRRHRNNV